MVSLDHHGVAAATAGLAVAMNGEEDTGATFWAALGTDEFTILDFVLRVLSFGVWTVSHYSSPPSDSAASSA